MHHYGAIQLGDMISTQIPGAKFHYMGIGKIHRSGVGRATIANSHLPALGMGLNGL